MKTLKNQKGFTLIEMTVVLILVGILAAFAAPRFFAMADAAASKAYAAAVDELNSQEKQQWTIAKMQDPTSWDDRLLVFDVLTGGGTTINLGAGYTWSGDVAASGPTNLQFKDSAQAVFTRTISTANVPGRWSYTYSF